MAHTGHRAECVRLSGTFSVTEGGLAASPQKNEEYKIVITDHHIENVENPLGGWGTHAGMLTRPRVTRPRPKCQGQGLGQGRTNQGMRHFFSV